MTVSASHAVNDRLRIVLEAMLATRYGRHRRIAKIARRPGAYRSSTFIDDITVHFEDGSRVPLVAKAAQLHAMYPDARRAKPAFVLNERRERATYESILTNADVGTARYLGSYEEVDGTRYLLLERAPGVPLRECGHAAWHAAARWLARMHTRIRMEAVAQSDAFPHLLRCDADFYSAWLQRACVFHRRLREDMQGLIDSHRYVVAALLAEKPAFIHGEYYASNILVNTHAHGGPAVCAVDWEMAAIGPALVDLACLVSGRWTDDERADIADTYHDEVAACGGRVPARAHYLRVLDCCLVHLSVTNLGWCDDWTPPAEHAFDWLGEALRLCEKWDL